MTKTASTSTLIRLLQEYEATHGVGPVISVGTMCCGNRTVEYILHVKDKEGNETLIEVPSEHEEIIWKGQI